MNEKLLPICFNSYVSIPNFKKINLQQYDQYDLIGFAYEISITDIENTDKEINCLFFFYLPYDFHQQKGSINFDILSPEQTGNFYNCIISYDKKKKSKNRTIKCEDGDTISFKLLKTQFEYQSEQDFLTNKNLFFSQTIYPNLNKFNELFEKNQIYYDQEDIDRFLIEVSKSISNHFSEEHLNEKLNPFLDQAKAYLLKEQIHNKLDIKTATTKKIKI